MDSDRIAADKAPDISKLLQQYGCGPIQFTGTDDALYERHLLFDNVVDPAAAGTAGAFRGRRPLRPGRPLAALGAHRADLRAREPQARLLPVDGVPDRPLAGQQHHEPAARSARRSEAVERQGSRLARRCSSRSPTPGWATAGSAGWRPASSTRWPRMQLPAMGYGLRYEYGIFRQTIRGRLAARAAGQLAAPARPVGGRPARREGRGQARLLVRGARRRPAARSPAGRRR